MSRPARDRVARRGAAALCVLGALVAFVLVGAAEESTPLAAEPAPLAAHGLLIAIATAGERLVAVGDRGIIVHSDDQGRNWVQASVVPTRALLTGVCFFDARRGIAVGHDEVILATADAGDTWTRTHYAPEAERPLLDVMCGPPTQAIAVGAYATYLTSNDAGDSWSARTFQASPPPKGRAGRPAAAESGGFHLNRIVAASDTRFYLAGEAGHLYRSDNGGVIWQELSSPYEGSFFGVLPLGGESVLAFGMRGNLYRSDDLGGNWQKIDTGTVAMLNGAARLDASGVAIVGLSGVVLVSRDGGRNFTLAQQTDRSGLSAVVRVGMDPAEIAVVGESGARLISLKGSP
ncbi:MAG TPA: hypothetical protein VEH54_05835 [Steroidobacteraceae bacterium]|nr:hypothetical protein [Steroidobacteraceae bacterium]